MFLIYRYLMPHKMVFLDEILTLVNSLELLAMNTQRNMRIKATELFWFSWYKVAQGQDLIY